MTPKLFVYCLAYCMLGIDDLHLTIVLKLLFLSNLSINSILLDCCLCTITHV
jgi:hypothetical protein